MSDPISDEVLCRMRLRLVVFERVAIEADEPTLRELGDYCRRAQATNARILAEYLHRVAKS